MYPQLKLVRRLDVKATYKPTVKIQHPVKYGGSREPQDSGRQHVMLHEDLSIYNRIVLAPTSLGETNSVTLCSDDEFCCTVTYEHSSSDLTYQFLVHSGIVKKGRGAFRYTSTL